MIIGLAVLSTAIFILLVEMLWRAGSRRKCRDCIHFQEQYITSLHGQGLFKFGYCQKVIYDCRMVEPDIERRCPDYEERIGEAELKEEGAPEGAERVKK